MICLLGLFNDVFSAYVKNGKMTVNDQMERIWKEQSILTSAFVWKL
jgi:hypothetical protein